MKKLLALSLCLATAGSLCAQKAVVANAAKLAGKTDKLKEARSLINDAMHNPETSQDPNTYFTAGEIEFKAYDNGKKAGAVNPSDPAADPMTLSQELLNGYKYYMQALPFDELPDAKGKVNPKFTKKIAANLATRANDYFNAGGTFYNGKKFYPEAYQAFIIFAEMPDQPFFGKAAPVLQDADRANAFFNAGISAYAGNSLVESANAFRNARKYGYEDPDALSYTYEIACWQNIQANDSTMAETATAQIQDVARAGYEKYGVEKPLFFNNLINYMVSDGQMGQAIEMINAEIDKNPQNGAMYGLRAFVLDRKGDEDESVADYRRAAAIADTDYETLKNAAKKIFRTGTEKWNLLEGNSKEVQLARQEVKRDYFEAAKEIADRAAAMNSNDPDLDYVLENINYALETYFNN